MSYLFERGSLTLRPHSFIRFLGHNILPIRCEQNDDSSAQQQQKDKDRQQYECYPLAFTSPS